MLLLFLWYIAINIVAIIILAYPRSSLRTRYLLPLFTGLTLALSCRVAHLPVPSNLRSAAALLLVNWLSHVINLVGIEDVVAGSDHETFRARLRTACKMLYNGRWIGTSMPAPSVRSATDICYSYSTGVGEVCEPKTGSAVPLSARLGYAARKWTKSFVIFVVLACYQFHVDVPTQVIVLRRTLGERLMGSGLIVRFCVVCHHFMTTILTFDGFHEFFAGLCVGVGMDELSEWPPFFGNVSEAYTVRRFWSHFWHQFVLRTYSSFAHVVGCRVLPAHNSQMKKCLHSILVFLVSGVLHTVALYMSGHGCSWYAEFGWFLKNGLAVVVETVFMKQIGVRCERLHWRCLGYVWVLGFMMFTIPERYEVRWSCPTLLPEA